MLPYWCMAPKFAQPRCYHTAFIIYIHINAQPSLIPWCCETLRADLPLLLYRGCFTTQHPALLWRGFTGSTDVAQAEAAYWQRSEGYRVGWSDELLGFDCGGQQWVLEAAFPTGTLR